MTEKTFFAVLAYLKLATAIVLATSLISLLGVSQTSLFVLYFLVLGWAIVRESLGQFVYAAVLSNFLFGWMVFTSNSTANASFWAGVSQWFLLGSFSLFMFHYLLSQARRFQILSRRVSRAECLSAVADIINGTSGDLGSKIRQVTAVLAEEIQKDGLRCRIILHGQDIQTLPPSGGNLGIHIPIEAGSEIFGTLILTGGKVTRLAAHQKTFFEALTGSLGLYLRREKAWTFFREKMSPADVSYILETPPARYDTPAES